MTENEKRYGKWQIAIRAQADALESGGGGFVVYPAPEGYFFADPFPVRDGSGWVVFFEHYDYAKGRLAYFRVDENLACSGFEFLDIPISCHASYPYVFEDGGKRYMVPELCHANEINLYECVSWPKKWALVKTIVPGCHNGDNSIVRHGDRYYLFTTIYQNGENKFCIFHSGSLLGEWRPHGRVNASSPANNADVTRGAGLIFSSGGRLVRPAQYSMNGSNGEAVVLYGIETLSPSEYSEKPISIFGRGQAPPCRNCHTYSHAGGLLAVDFCGERETDRPAKPIGEASLVEVRQRNFYPDHDLLSRAFSTNTSGNGLCYYGATLGGVLYEGERDFDARWDLVKSCGGFGGARVLDIGCNMGIMLCYLKAFMGISHGVGIDQPDDMLASTNKSGTMRAALLLRRAFGLGDGDVSFIQEDINSPGYWDRAPVGFDLVIATSVYKWVEDKEGFMRYLSGAGMVLYEGHEPDEVEVGRFAAVGFSAKVLGRTRTGVHYAPSDTRTLILFHKNTAP
jgi:SAM-dependent methyltransferase